MVGRLPRRGEPLATAPVQVRVREGDRSLEPRPALSLPPLAARPPALRAPVSQQPRFARLYKPPRPPLRCGRGGLCCLPASSLPLLSLPTAVVFPLRSTFCPVFGLFWLFFGLFPPFWASRALFCPSLARFALSGARATPSAGFRPPHSAPRAPSAPRAASLAFPRPSLRPLQQSFSVVWNMAQMFFRRVENGFRSGSRRRARAPRLSPRRPPAPPARPPASAVPPSPPPP